jgi:hypothetical protein
LEEQIAIVERDRDLKQDLGETERPLSLRSRWSRDLTAVEN